MYNPLNIEIGDKIKNFCGRCDCVVRQFIFVDNRERALSNPTTLKEYEDNGKFWAISIQGIGLESDEWHLVPINRIGSRSLDKIIKYV